MGNFVYLAIWGAAVGTGMWLVQSAPLEPWPKRVVQGVCVLCFLGSVGRHFGVI